jgi:hypothetical protein
MTDVCPMSSPVTDLEPGLDLCLSLLGVVEGVAHVVPDHGHVTEPALRRAHQRRQQVLWLHTHERSTAWPGMDHPWQQMLTRPGAWGGAKQPRRERDVISGTRWLLWSARGPGVQHFRQRRTTHLEERELLELDVHDVASRGGRHHRDQWQVLVGRCQVKDPSSFIHYHHDHHHHHQ